MFHPHLTPPLVSSLQPVSSPPPIATPSLHVALHPLIWDLPKLTSIGLFTQVICGGCLQSRSLVHFKHRLFLRRSNILTMFLCVDVMMSRDRHTSCGCHLTTRAVTSLRPAVPAAPAEVPSKDLQVLRPCHVIFIYNRHYRNHAERLNLPSLPQTLLCGT